MHTLYCSRAFPVEAKPQDLRPGLLLVPPFPAETWRAPLPAPAPHPAPGTVCSPHASFQMTVCFSPREVTPLHPAPTSQPPELPEKPAPVPSDETADPAERRPAPRIAAGDRQGEPGAPAGETQREARAARAFHVLSSTSGELFRGTAIRRASAVNVPLQEIRTNQADFIQMLNEPNPEAVPGGGGLGAGGLDAGGTAGDTSNASPMRYIQVTPQEKEAIERVRTE